jgi:hypothetical protein
MSVQRATIIRTIISLIKQLGVEQEIIQLLTAK